MIIAIALINGKRIAGRICLARKVKIKLSSGVNFTAKDHWTKIQSAAMEINAL